MGWRDILADRLSVPMHRIMSGQGAAQGSCHTSHAPAATAAAAAITDPPLHRYGPLCRSVRQRWRTSGAWMLRAQHRTACRSSACCSSRTRKWGGRCSSRRRSRAARRHASRGSDCGWIEVLFARCTVCELCKYCHVHPANCICTRRPRCNAGLRDCGWCMQATCSSLRVMPAHAIGLQVPLLLQFA